MLSVSPWFIFRQRKRNSFLTKVGEEAVQESKCAIRLDETLNAPCPETQFSSSMTLP